MYNYPKKYLYEIMQIIAYTDHNYIRPFGCLLQEEVNRKLLLLSRAYVIRYNIDDFNKELRWEIIV